MRPLAAIPLFAIAFSTACAEREDTTGAQAADADPISTDADDVDATGSSDPDSGVSPTAMGGWRMRGRDRRRTHRSPLGPSRSLVEASPFLTLETGANIRAPVIDSQGNLFLGVSVWDGQNSTSTLRSYSPDGSLRFERPLSDSPQELALGNQEQVFVLTLRTSDWASFIVSFDKDGKELWSKRYDDARDLVVASDGDLVFSTRNSDDVYSTVRLRSDGSERWQIDEGGQALAIGDQDVVYSVINAAGATSLIEPAAAVAAFDEEGQELWRHDLDDDLHDGALALTDAGEVAVATTVVNEGGVSQATAVLLLSSQGDVLWEEEIAGFLPRTFTLLVLPQAVVIPGFTAIGLNSTTRSIQLADGSPADSLCGIALAADDSSVAYSSCNENSIRGVEVDGSVDHIWHTPGTSTVAIADDGTLYMVPNLYTRKNELLKLEP